MNIQKIHIFKDRKIILKHIFNLCRNYNINIKKIAVVGEVSKDFMTFYILCSKRNKKRFFKNFFKIQTPNCGNCYYIVQTFKSLREDLLNTEKPWSINDDKHFTILDLSHKYKNIIENPNKKSIWYWFKNLF